MAKTKISAKPKSSSVKLTEWKLDKALFKNKNQVREALIKCLFENDLDAFEDVLITYLKVASKSAVAKETKLGRRTLYDLIEGKRPFNPTLSTLGPILKSLKAA